MRTPVVAGVALVCALPVQARAQGRVAGPVPRGLVALDSARVIEDDSLFLAQPTEVALGPNGNLYVSETSEGRVLEIAPNGRIARVFGRRGRGPGELAAPSTLAIGGDSLLLVWDRGERRLSIFDLRTGRFVRQLGLSLAWPPAMRVVGSEILIRNYDFDAGTSLMRLSAEGDTLGAEGVLPALGRQRPILMQGAFAISVLAPDGDAIFAMFEVSPLLYRWQRGTRTAREITVPAVRRRGVRPSLFEEMMRDPGSAARLVWNRSIPIALEVVRPGTLGLVTMDYAMEDGSHAAVFYVTLVDVMRNRVCSDLPIPASTGRVRVRDPLPRVAVAGDRLVVLEQGLGTHGDPAPMLRRFRIDPAACQWAPIPP
ncbi:MAG TPA: hypothetical protein VLE53_19235 [Gemmatimonadaceae bacterium]|nr:hypothetical protein [Gemmatimonadaceae bacterium]